MGTQENNLSGENVQLILNQATESYQATWSYTTTTTRQSNYEQKDMGSSGPGGGEGWVVSLPPFLTMLLPQTW